MRKALESIVIPVFSTAFKYGSDDKRQKLLKVDAKSSSYATVRLLRVVYDLRTCRYMYSHLDGDSLCYSYWLFGNKIATLTQLP